MGVGSAARFLTPAEVAKISGMHVGSIRRALNAGRIPGVKLGARWLIDADAVFGLGGKEEADGECSNEGADGESAEAFPSEWLPF